MFIELEETAQTAQTAQEEEEGGITRRKRKRDKEEEEEDRFGGEVSKFSDYLFCFVWLVRLVGYILLRVGEPVCVRECVYEMDCWVDGWMSSV